MEKETLDNHTNSRGCQIHAKGTSKSIRHVFSSLTLADYEALMIPIIVDKVHWLSLSNCTKNQMCLIFFKPLYPLYLAMENMNTSYKLWYIWVSAGATFCFDQICSGKRGAIQRLKLQVIYLCNVKPAFRMNAGSHYNFQWWCSFLEEVCCFSIKYIWCNINLLTSCNHQATLYRGCQSFHLWKAQRVLLQTLFSKITWG